MTIYLCSLADGPYADREKTRQTYSLPKGTIHTWGYRPKWIHPDLRAKLEKMAADGESGTPVRLAVIKGTDVDPLREATIRRVGDYSHADDPEQGFIRIDVVFGESLMASIATVDQKFSDYLAFED